MKADKRFVNLPLDFWANVRAVSESIGYTRKKASTILEPSLEDIKKAMKKRGLSCGHLISPLENKPTPTGRLLCAYFKYRAKVLNDYVRPRLMDVRRAKAEFEKLKCRLKPSCPLPMNKQKGDKKAPAYLTGIVNMLIEANAKNHACDLNPRQLTSFTRNGAPLRTLSRRVDGVFPETNNPVALWEIKEYYYTTTFGSRIADGVYETLLDGMELKELHENTQTKALHYLIIDAYNTWWDMGRSYLCRIIDALSMGYIDEVLFGYEVVEKLPTIVRHWGKVCESRNRKQ